MGELLFLAAGAVLGAGFMHLHKQKMIAAVNRERDFGRRAVDAERSRTTRCQNELEYTRDRLHAEQEAVRMERTANRSYSDGYKQGAQDAAMQKDAERFAQALCERATAMIITRGRATR